MRRAIVSYVIIILCVCNHVKGQQVSLFQSITKKEGLPSNYVLSVSEDENGFLWLGTDKGLAQYDGFRWQTFNTDNGMPGNYVRMILPDNHRGLWLGLSVKGLFHYDIVQKKYTYIASDAMDHLFESDSSGNIFYYTRTNDTLRGYSVSPLKPGSQECCFTISNFSRINCIYTDFISKEIVLLTDSFPVSTGYNIALQSSKWRVVRSSKVHEYIGLVKKVSDHIFKSATSLYIAKGDDSPYTRIPLFQEHNKYNNTLRDAGGTWAWNEKNGLFYITDEGKTIHYTEAEGLPNDMVTSLCHLRNGGLLIGTLGGGLSYKLTDGNAVINIEGGTVKALSQNGSNVFAITENKLISLDLGRAFRTRSLPVSDKNIQSIDAFGSRLFISTLNGLSAYNYKKDKLLKTGSFSCGAGLCNVIHSEDKYLAGTFGTYVFSFNENLEGQVKDSASFFVSERVQSTKNGYACYNYEDGIRFIAQGRTPVTLTQKNGLPSNCVYHIEEYRDTTWISTKSGIAVYTNGKIVKTITAEQGLVGNRCIYSFHDTTGAYWIVTDKYLARYLNGKVVTYSSALVKDNKSDLINTCLFNRPSNTLVTGGLYGLYLNNLTHIKSKKPALRPALTSIQYDSRPVSGFSGFEIPLDFNQLAFTFAPFDVNPFTASTTYYRLEGISEEFGELRDSLTVKFYKLSSGHYRLVAKTKNADGLESEALVLASFSVTPPFWQQGWFYILTSLLLASIIFGIFILIQKRKLRQLKKDEQLNARLTAERVRISKDLHDNLGTSLVTILAQSDNIEMKLAQQNSSEALIKTQQLSDETRNALNILRETIWAVQEKSHSISDFVLRLRFFLQRLYAPTNIDWDIAAPTHEVMLGPNQTLQLFRILQEASQNICKHAKASHVKYIFTTDNQEVKALIADNGKGFDINEFSDTNGLRNMQQRARELNGCIEIRSEKEAGTRIEITFKAADHA